MNYGPHIRLDSFEDIHRAIILLEREGVVGQTHLFRCLHAGRTAYVPVPLDPTSGKFNAWVRLTGHKPAVACIGDDKGLDQGPGDWKTTQRDVQWARSILLHGTGAEVWHSVSFVDRATQERLSAAVIEALKIAHPGALS
jgi:hypothetical protein